MADIEQTIQEQMGVSASGYRSGYRFDLSEDISPSASGYNQGSQIIQDDVFIDASGLNNAGSVDSEDFIGINTIPISDQTQQSESGDDVVVINTLEDDGVQNSKSGDDVVDLSDLEYFENRPGYTRSRGMQIADSASNSYFARPPDISLVDGDYLGKVPIDIISYDDTGMNLTAQYLDGYNWKNASLTGNSNLIGSASGVPYTAYWNAVDDISSPLNTRLKISDGHSEIETEEIYVEAPLGNNVFPILAINNGLTPASGYYMSSKYAAVNSDHYPIDSVKIVGTQYVNEKKSLFHHSFSPDASGFIGVFDAGSDVLFKDIEVLSHIVGDSTVSVSYRVAKDYQTSSQLQHLDWKHLGE